MLDYYKILGLYPSCTEDEIKKAYRKLASLYHPDKHIQPSIDVNVDMKKEEKKEIDMKGMIEKFYQIQEAYQILSDIDSRTEYDRQRLLCIAKNSTINAEVIHINELTMIHMDDGEILYEKTCRCGGVFEISGIELSEGYTTVQCSGCSLYIDIDQPEDS